MYLDLLTTLLSLRFAAPLKLEKTNPYVRNDFRLRYLQKYGEPHIHIASKLFPRQIGLFMDTVHLAVKLFKRGFRFFNLNGPDDSELMLVLRAGETR
jgi:hypothetical protein